eukprot:gene7089-7153_t
MVMEQTKIKVLKLPDEVPDDALITALNDLDYSNPEVVYDIKFRAYLGIGKLMIYFSTPFKQVANGLERFKVLAYMSIGSNVVRCTGLVLLFLLHYLCLTGVIIVFISGDLMELLCCLMLFKISIKTAWRIKWDGAGYFSLLRESFPQTGVVLITSALSRFDWIFIGFTLSAIKLAEYSFAYKIFEIATLPLLAIAPILIPRFTKLAEMIVAALVALILNVCWVPVIAEITADKYGSVNGRLNAILISFIITLVVNVGFDRFCRKTAFYQLLAGNTGICNRFNFRVVIFCNRVNKTGAQKLIDKMTFSIADYHLKKLQKAVDWKLLLFLLLFLNVKLAVKIPAVVIIYLLQFNFKFGFSFKNSPMHQIKLSVESNTVKVLHNTILLFFIINAVVSVSTLAFIMIDAHAINPFRYQGQYQKYFLGTGDYIKGENAADGVNLHGCFAVNSQQFYEYGFTPGINRNVSPQNSQYAHETVKNIIHPPRPPFNHTAVLNTTDSTKNPDFIKRTFAKHYLDSLKAIAINHAANNQKATITPANLPKTDAGRIILISADINTPPYQTPTDTPAEQRKLLAFINFHKADLPLAGRDSFKVTLPGKVIGFIQTLQLIKNYPAKILTGSGMGNFSSKLAFKATGLTFSGGFPAKYIYINRDFLPNKGVSSALNQGLSRARSPYIARFDADDICHPDRLKIQYEFITSYPEYSIIGSAADYLDAAGHYIFTHHPDVILKNGGYNEYAYTYEDHFLWVNILADEKACNLSQALIKVRLNPESITIDEKWHSKKFLDIKYGTLKKRSITAAEGDVLQQISGKNHSPRSTLYTVRGGDTVQVLQTARQLSALRVDASILLSNEQIDYDKYNLLHFFNITRPADILYHAKKSGKPFVVSTILCNYSEYDKHHRKGIGVFFTLLPADSIEYLKTMARWLMGKDHLASINYIWKGQHKSILEILKKTALILPNSKSEYQRVGQTYLDKVDAIIVPNGINPDLFIWDRSAPKDDKLVLCAARIEGIKNQLNLIKALNNTGYQLLIIGNNSPNQKAKVHVLPSWFETTGLSSIEAAAMGCNVVITDKGDTREYFGDYAYYCDPAEPESIFNAVKKASESPVRTRGIPNHYGGFEHISEYVSEGLVKRGHAVTVYNSHNHPYRERSKFDVVLIMGYTSSSVWGKLYPRDSTIITNMDGLEWKRSKYSPSVQKFLRYAEKLAVKHSQFYISDSMVIKSYLADKYQVNSKYIPYGADLFSEEEREQADSSEVLKEDYFLLMARMEPENNIETILEGFNNSSSHRKFKVLGDTGNRFGKFITHKFKNDERIEFKGSIFDTGKVRSLQNNSYLYFHGHSVGGTNPSLLEAMASEALIAAHNNPFNKSVLNADAFYFSNAKEVRNLVETVQRKDTEKAMVSNNLQKIKYQFNWEKIIDEYEKFIIESHYKLKHERIIPNKG